MKNILVTLLVIMMWASTASAASFGAVNPSTTDLPPSGATRPESNPLRQLDDLILVTEKTVSEEKILRRQIADYFKVKANYLQDQQNKDAIIQLVKAAHQVQQSIETQHLAYLFDSELLQELKFFSQIASKKGLPRP